MTYTEKFNPSMTTPWGRIQTYDKLADGVVQVHCAGHGGLWLSPKRIEQLPPEYEPYLDKKQWAEEDEDAALALQYLGLLSLVEKDLTLEITNFDLLAGVLSREQYYGKFYYGGPIVEAYQRQTGDKHDKMTCTDGRIFPSPGGFKLANLCDKAKALMEATDAGKTVEPTTVTLLPYTVPEPKRFTHYLADGKTFVNKVNGYLAERLLSEDRHDKKFMDDHIKYTKFCYPKLAETVKIVYEDTVIYEKE